MVRQRTKKMGDILKYLSHNFILTIGITNYVDEEVSTLFRGLITIEDIWFAEKNTFILVEETKKEKDSLPIVTFTIRNDKHLNSLVGSMVFARSFESNIKTKQPSPGCIKERAVRFVLYSSYVPYLLRNS
ncbi:hypothetical protein SAMN05216353_13238 [Halobacillus alkaliphilus]|uniref:Uncharacterized protein n=1 Tax=Halobacillus alkaliphilus TaxID=396056 RepID=A0A1I2QRM7_9BACI|nr:hypothetical protein SAMN05216353_13238 [Halobacillus alkaliphilus]